MKFSVEKARPLIPAGEHVLKLSSVEGKEMDDHYGRSATGKTTRYVWSFVSNESDDDGVPFEYAVFTGDQYGNAKAGMTLLVDMLVPGMTPEKFEDFDSDDLIGKRFKAQIKHQAREDGKGMAAKHVYIAPLNSSKLQKPAENKPAAPVANDDDDRPICRGMSFGGAATAARPSLRLLQKH